MNKEFIKGYSGLKLLMTSAIFFSVVAGVEAVSKDQSIKIWIFAIAGVWLAVYCVINAYKFSQNTKKLVGNIEGLYELAFKMDQYTDEALFNGFTGALKNFSQMPSFKELLVEVLLGKVSKDSLQTLILRYVQSNSIEQKPSILSKMRKLYHYRFGTHINTIFDTYTGMDKTILPSDADYLAMHINDFLTVNDCFANDKDVAYQIVFFIINHLPLKKDSLDEQNIFFIFERVYKYMQKRFEKSVGKQRAFVIYEYMMKIFAERGYRNLLELPVVINEEKTAEVEA